MKILSYIQFINEENSIQKIKMKLLKANQKVENFNKKAEAALEEVKLRKMQLEYEKEKEKIKREIETATNNTAKGMAKDKLKKLKEKWKENKKELKDHIKNLKK